jgi:hypothetical protein
MAWALASGVPEKNAPAQKSILEGILGPVVGERTLKVLRRCDVKAYFRRRRASCDGNRLSRP